MSEPRTLSLLPWQVTLTEFTAKAGKGGSDAACVAFVVDPSIPQIARGGYASLVMAYSRADEPVCVLDDGAALVLVLEGGIPSGKALAERVLVQMRRLALDLTLTAGVTLIGDDAAQAVTVARAAAVSVAPGKVGAHV
jgi:hypothetical protein